MPNAIAIDSAMEMFFSGLPPRTLSLARGAATRVFGSAGAPKDFIAVHLRWGDRGKEMELVSIVSYLAAVEELQAKHNTKVPVFLATEDPVTLSKFTKAAPASWRVHVYFPTVSGSGALHSQRK